MKKETLHPKKLMAAAIVALLLTYFTAKLTTVLSSAAIMAILSVGTIVGRELVEVAYDSLMTKIREIVNLEVTGVHSVVVVPQPRESHSKENILRKVLSSRWGVVVVFIAATMVSIGITIGTERLSHQQPRTIVQHTTKVVNVSNGQLKKIQKSTETNTQTQLHKSQETDYYNAQYLVEQAQQKIDLTTTNLQSQITSLTKSLSSLQQADGAKISSLEVKISALRQEIANLRSAHP